MGRNYCTVVGGSDFEMLAITTPELRVIHLRASRGSSVGSFNGLDGIHNVRPR